MPAWIGAIAQAVTALSVIFLLLQIRDSRNNAKGERTSAIQERYQSDEFSSSARRTLGCTDVNDAGECVDLIKAWSNRDHAGEEVLPRPDGDLKASVHDIEKTLSLFEDMGTAYNLDQLDRKVLLRSFSIPTVQVFTTAWWLICWQRHGRLAREKENGMVESVYLEYQDMCTALRKADPSLVANPELKTVAAIRALVLPPGHGEKVEDDEAWSASRRLSLSLSAFIRQTERRGELAPELSKLALAIEGAHAVDSKPLGQGSIPGWEIVLVPGNIDQPCDGNWKKQRAAAARLAHAIDRAADRQDLEVAIAHLEAISAEQPRETVDAGPGDS